MSNSGTLFIVSTPIGNMQDITLRALETLKSVDLILAEDTRRTGQLLQHFSINKPMLSFHEHNENQRADEVLAKLKEGHSLALVSDAGTPLVSDPGYKLVRSCIENGIKVESNPGPTAAIAALTVSGLPPDKFLFIGFLPEKQGKRQRLLESIKDLFFERGRHDRVEKSMAEVLDSTPLRSNNKNEYFAPGLKATIILYESPYHLKRTLDEIQATLGNIPIVICRELTKMHEEVFRGSIEEAIHRFQNPKGEFVLLF